MLRGYLLRTSPRMTFGLRSASTAAGGGAAKDTKGAHSVNEAPKAEATTSFGFEEVPTAAKRGLVDGVFDAVASKCGCARQGGRGL